MTERSWHYVWYPGRDTQELYDKRSDPEENRDVSAVHPEVTSRGSESVARVETEARDES